MKSAKQKKFVWTTLLRLLTVLSLLASFVGCSRISFVSDHEGDGSLLTDAENENLDEIPAIQPLEQIPLHYNRYTGLACDEALLSCRPISVCIGNFDGNRQMGLSYADVLVEAPIDGDKTRLWAIMATPTAATTLSSVATVRDYMMPISRAFGAIGAYAGTTDTIGATATVHDGDNLDYLYHNLTATFTKNENGTLSTSGEAVKLAATERGYSLTETGCALPYRHAEVGTLYTPEGNTIKSISFRYSMANTISFRYNSENGLYFREQQGASHMDAATETQLSFSNVLLLYHNVNYYHTPTDTSFSLDTSSGGDGYLYTGGGVVSVHWRYASDGSLSVTTDEGEIVTVNRGKTYIGMLRITDSTSLIAK